jgi:hypothetical protein
VCAYIVQLCIVNGEKMKGSRTGLERPRGLQKVEAPRPKNCLQIICVNVNFVPRCKHSVSVIKTIQSVQYREIKAVCSHNLAFIVSVFYNRSIASSKAISP